MSQPNFLEMAISQPLKQIFDEYPFCRGFFQNLRINDIDINLTLSRALEKTSRETLEDFGLDKDMIFREFCLFLETFARGGTAASTIASLTVIGGKNKNGEPEIAEWSASIGETISIVGPTGSGKSRLLADIECLADIDTPTGRKILIDGESISEQQRFDMEGKLVAQLSQNMNFVMDLTVKEFLEMHAGSRFIDDIEDAIDRCFSCANSMAGEKFELSTKLTQLSGGQSRALMIADTAFMSASPIVLIDEIENAGIDRRQAIEILARKEKIVFISTHDPLLALSADKRIVIKNGGVSQIIVTSANEKNCLDTIQQLDSTFSRLRKALRQGGQIDMNIFQDKGKL